ncbi:MAG: hypothetical protein IT379_36170 [Deltaproteobacteria bacterium]|nr:hypothetical protein [Deltaproteobacteria bacterium]
MERAQEAADDAGFWDTFGEVAAWVGAAVAVVAAIPTGGATLALAGVAAAAAIGSQYAGDIAEVMCDAGIIDRSALDDWTLGLSIGCAAVALAAGIGGAFAGAGAAASQLSAVERGVRTSSQVAQTAAGLAQGVSTGGGAVCRSDEADARVDAERSEHRADVAQQERDETIELIHGTAQAWCREMRRMTEMVRAAHDTASQALAANRA